MRTRITLAFVAILALALFAAGVVSLLLVRHASSVNAQRTVLAQARAIGANPKVVTTPGVLPMIQAIAGINREAVIVIGANGRLLSKPPPGLPSGAVDTAPLQLGKLTSGTQSHVAFAAVPLFSIDAGSSTGRETVALVFESPENFSVANVLYFLLAGGISLLVAAAISMEISRRITRHVTAAAAAANRIASGDFGTRVVGDARGYPELAGLQASLNTMAEELERAQYAERQFLLSISHELRTPLTSIRGYAEAIAEGMVADLPKAAQVVVAEADRLERLIGDLLSLARLSARQFTFTLRELDVAEVAEHSAEALRYEFAVAGVALVIHAPARAIPGLVDRDRVAQIVANLLENALKFARTRVELSIEPSGLDHWVVTVTDDGPGIAPEDLGHIFERLFTSTRHEARAAGTGLGLAIVAELTEAMGGVVHARSPLGAGGGTAVEVELPRRIVVAEPFRPAAAADG